MGSNVFISTEIRELIRNKRILRRIYQNSRNQIDKANWNRALNYIKNR